MAKNFPEFEISAVVDGNLKGLLVTKIDAVSGNVDHQYFYPDTMEGLQPTEEIKNKCRYYCKLTNQRYELVLFEFLFFYAKKAVQEGKNRFTIDLIKDYPRNFRPNYSTFITNYFDSPASMGMRHCFEEGDIFREKVMSGSRKGKVAGRARRFAVLSPHDITLRGFDYLQPIGDVLKKGYKAPDGSDIKPEWFRKEGPLAVDFKKERVFTRKSLFQELKDMVLANFSCILEGKAAIGKTVLVRQLGYELCKEKYAVYYFDCCKDFTWDKLRKEINAAQGIIIIEDIHLDTEKMQHVLSEIKTEPNRHVLFVARNSYKYEEKHKLPKFSNLPSMKLKPFVQVDDIIDQYASSKKHFDWSEKIKKRIKSVCSESFWLLAYALKGRKQTGEPKEWIKAEVCRDLEQLGLQRAIYPYILVSLSPLYKNEVMTDEYFLLHDLNFQNKQEDAFNELLKMGEITKKIAYDGNVYYGLPHSALAELYWDYGGRYKKLIKLPRYFDFILSYSSSGATNGLEAILNLPTDTAIDIYNKMKRMNKFIDCFSNESSLYVINKWLTQIVLSRGYIGDIYIKIIADKIVWSPNILHSLNCIYLIYIIQPEKGEVLLTLIDRFKLLKQVENVRSDLTLLLCKYMCDKIRRYSIEQKYFKLMESRLSLITTTLSDKL